MTEIEQARELLAAEYTKAGYAARLALEPGACRLSEIAATVISDVISIDRQRFEEWASGLGMLTGRSSAKNDWYHDHSTAMAWEGWKARITPPPKESGPSDKR